jgi:pectinesterase
VVLRRRTSEIGFERRNGYSWYTNDPQEIFKLYPSWKAKWIK